MDIVACGRRAFCAIEHIGIAAVGLVAVSHVVTTLGRQVAKAREMGSYRLGELLGACGIGEVYKASHRILARPAAIKLVRPEMLGGTDPAVAVRAIGRCRPEAGAAAHLRSANTVARYDFGVTDDQNLYVAIDKTSRSRPCSPQSAQVANTNGRGKVREFQLASPALYLRPSRSPTSLLPHAGQNAATRSTSQKLARPPIT
jgi:hypothetical protein